MTQYEYAVRETNGQLIRDTTWASVADVIASYHGGNYTGPDHRITGTLLRAVRGSDQWEPCPTDAAEVRVTSHTGGQKGSKLARFDLIPAGPLYTVAELFGKGAEKYEDRNWERGYDWSLSFAALNRHLWQFWNGEDNDQGTGLPHLASVAFHALALLEFMDRHPEFDNRPNPPRKPGGEQ